HPAAEGGAEQLMPEADAEIRHPPLDHRLADGALLGNQPGMLLLLPDIHRATHHPERVVTRKRRDRLAGVELDGVPRDAIGGEEVAENAGMLDCDVLEDENAHGETLRRKSTAR